MGAIVEGSPINREPAALLAFFALVTISSELTSNMLSSTARDDPT
jgi:hypothetical protein